METRIVDLAQSKNWAEEIAKKITGKTICLLQGDLGAGKTQWSQFLVKALGGGEASSPTYSIINQYPLADGYIYHVDLYRLESEDEIESSGFWDLFAEPKDIVIIEWPERLTLTDLPRSWSQLNLKIDKTEHGDQRRVELRTQKNC